MLLNAVEFAYAATVTPLQKEVLGASWTCELLCKFKHVTFHYVDGGGVGVGLARLKWDNLLEQPCMHGYIIMAMNSVTSPHRNSSDNFLYYIISTLQITFLSEHFIFTCIRGVCVHAALTFVVSFWMLRIPRWNYLWVKAFVKEWNCHAVAS